MNNCVITIARGFGSGGLTMGKQLAKELNISCYDRDLLRLASDDSGINESLFAKADETLKNSLIYKVAKSVYKGELIPPDRDDFISNENLFNYQAKIIKKLAQTESCVIIGRCADYVLKDFDNVLRLYIHAPLPYCIDTVAHKFYLSNKESKKLILTTDKRRASYYHYFTGQDWKDADHYDLCINSSILEQDKCIALVKSYLDIKFN